MDFQLRYLLYDNSRFGSNASYGEVVSIINDRQINVDIGGGLSINGQSMVLNNVIIEGSYIPKLGDWVGIEWRDGQPVAVGTNNGLSSVTGLQNINNDVKIISTTDLANNVITSNHIQANSIDANHIQAGTITSQQISAGSITGDSIATNTLTSKNISANSITGDRIAFNTITGQQIMANTISGGNIISNTITSIQISAGSLTGDRLQSNTITSAQISAGGINADRISANSITSQQIAVNSIGADRLINWSLTSQQISAGSIQGDRISAGTITTDLISANSITTSLIQAGAITSTQISANSITSQQIAVNSISANRIINNSITSQQISAGSISSDRLQANSITSQQISAGSIQSDRISANTITGQQIAFNSIYGTNIAFNTITGQNVSANSISGNQIIGGSIQGDRISANTISGGNIMANTISGGNIIAGTITGQQISANTISGGNIIAGGITTSQISAGSITGALLAVNSIQSQHISAGSVTTSDISANSITTALIAAGAITTPLISANAITGQLLAVNSVQSQHVSANSIQSQHVSANSIQTQHISANSVQANQISANTINSNHISANSIQTRHISAGSVTAQQISAGTITATQIASNTITASNMQAGTISANSAVLASGSITNAVIANGAITNAKIGYGEITSALISSGTITSANIGNAQITDAHITNLNASKLNAGYISASLISAGTITGQMIAAQTISGNNIKAGTIDSTQIKAGAITALQIASQTITADQIQSSAITADKIRVGSITADKISTVGLDAQIVQVYNGKTGEVLIGGGYLKVDGLDVGVIQSDNLLANGIFQTSSEMYGYLRSNETGASILGVSPSTSGGNQIWKYDLSTHAVVQTITINGNKPTYMAIDGSGNYAYVSTQGDNTLTQVDLNMGMIGQKLNVGKGPGRIKWSGSKLGDMKHMLMVNTDINAMNEPDSFMVIDVPPMSLSGNLYIHHEIVMGATPYDLVTTSDKMTYVTLAGQGDVMIIDMNNKVSMYWKVSGTYSLGDYGTDNYHGGLDGEFGLGESVGGSWASDYETSGMDMSMQDPSSGYTMATAPLIQYAPHGISASTDETLLYVAENNNGLLIVLDRFNQYIHTMGLSGGNTSGGSMGGMNMGGMDFGTPTGDTGTLYTGGTLAPNQMLNNVKYRIPIGDSPEFIAVAQGRVYVTCYGSNEIAVLNESDLMMDGMDTSSISVGYINVGLKPLDILPDISGNNLYVSLNGTNQIACVDATTTNYTNAVKWTVSAGANVMGLAITPDGKYLFGVNNGDIGTLSFSYPSGNFIGDAYIGLEGDLVYQGADYWTPNRTNWVRDASGNVTSAATVEFHLNEPFLNEGGYAKLSVYGDQTQWASIEQDIFDVTNYSNGNNTAQATQEILTEIGTGNVYQTKNQWLTQPININANMISSGNTMITAISSNQYSIDNTAYTITFSANAIPSGGWVTADYTYRDNTWFKYHNGSIEIAVDNSSSTNFNTQFEIEEWVPNFVVWDNQQTNSFTPTYDGISGTTYNGLIYSDMTNRAMMLMSGNISYNGTPVSGNSNPTVIVDGMTGTGNMYFSQTVPSGTTGYVQLDLGKAYMIDMVNVWHHYDDGRTYNNTKTQVSEDGMMWMTIFDSATSGTYKETSSGNSIMFMSSPVRYIRDYCGTSVSGNYNPTWVEIEAFGDWEVESQFMHNHALGLSSGNITLSGGTITPTWGDNSVTDISRIMGSAPNNLPDSNFPFNAGSGNATITVDLGSIYNIDVIKVWHYYADGRKYNNAITQVSNDGVNWTTVYSGNGTYAEAPSGNMITVTGNIRYIRDSISGNNIDHTNQWCAISAYEGYDSTYSYVYPLGSDRAGQNLATNGRCFLTTDISGAYVELKNTPINFTTWWWMTYIKGPEFGELEVDMVDMGMSHYLQLGNNFYDKYAHRHIMSYAPGNHTSMIKQKSGKISIDRFRFEDYQYFTKSSTLIPNNASRTFTRYKIVPTSAQYYIGTGRQSTDGAFDTPRVSSITNQPDFSVPIKYRVRVISTLNGDGTRKQGTAYVTSGIFETGKLSTSWRMSQGLEKIAGNRLEAWNSNAPGKTGIQHYHIANGSISGPKISTSTIMDYHISPYARIPEYKLLLNNPTQPYGGSGGHYGSSNAMARFDHDHDDRYITASGGVVSNLNINTLSANTAILPSVSGNMAIGGNLTVTGNINGYNLSTLNSNINTNSGNIVTISGNLNKLSGNIVTISGNVNTVSGNVDTVSGNLVSTNSTLTSHIGAGGTAHALVTSANAGFMDSASWNKLQAIQSSAINQTTADGRYLQLTGGTLTGNLSLSGNRLLVGTNPTDLAHSIYYTLNDAYGVQLDGPRITAWGGVEIYQTNGNNQLARFDSGGATVLGNTIWHSGNLTWSGISGNYGIATTMSRSDHGHTVSQISDISNNYYNQSQVNNLLAGKVGTSGNNTISGQNTFTATSSAIKIQPSSAVASGTALFQLTDNTGSHSLAMIDGSGNMTVQSLTVIGTTVQQQAQTLSGNQVINGTLTVNGNSTLGNATTSVTTVNGTLKVPSGGSLQVQGYYQEVMRFPVYGIGGDFQFDTTDTTMDKLVSHYSTFTTDGGSCLPATQTGANRYYKILLSYSITGSGNGATLEIDQMGTTTAIGSWSLPSVWGASDGTVRTWLSPAFQTTYTGHTDWNTKLNQASGELTIKYIEVIAYDVF